MPDLKLDATDRTLLALLRENARAPVAELARGLKLSRTTVQSRIERLERHGVIAGYTVVVADEIEAGWVRAHVLITLAPRRSGAIEQALRKIPELRVLHSVSGPLPDRHRRRGLDRRARHADRPHRPARRRRAHHLGDRAFHPHRALAAVGRGGSSGACRVPKSTADRLHLQATALPMEAGR